MAHSRQVTPRLGCHMESACGIRVRTGTELLAIPGRRDASVRDHGKTERAALLNASSTRPASHRPG